MVNMNDFANEVAAEEGKLVSVDIGQIKEILTITMKKLALLSDEDLAELMSRYR